MYVDLTSWKCPSQHGICILCTHACIHRWLYIVRRCSITPAFTIALMSPVFLSGVGSVRVKTRSSILAGNDPASLLSFSPKYLHCWLLLCVPYLPLFLSAVLHLWVTLCCKTVWVVVRAWCRPVSTPYEDVCETFTQLGYKKLWKAALGTNQAENPLIPGVTIRYGMLTWYGTGWCLRWGGLVVYSLEDLSLKTPWQVNKAKALILKLHNDWVHVIHRDWSHLCCTVRSVILMRSSALYSSAEYNIKHCWRSVWNLSSFIMQCLNVSRFVKCASIVCTQVNLKVGVCVNTCHLFRVVSLFRACISYCKPPGGKVVTALNKCYLWPPWQLLIQELCTRKPTPSAW